MRGTPTGSSTRVADSSKCLAAKNKARYRPSDVNTRRNFLGHTRLDRSVKPQRPQKALTLALSYLFLSVACLAAMACCFFLLAVLALDCFCVACLCTDFGDLSPISVIFQLAVCSLAA